MEDAGDLALQVALQVDQQVAADDQVEAGERRVADQVVRGEDAHLAHLFHQLAGVILPGEEAREPVRRHVLGDALGVASQPREVERLVVDIAGEDLHARARLATLHRLAEQDRDRVGLLAGGAARRPDADLSLGPGVVEKPRDHLALERGEGLGIAEEVRDADQQVAEELLRLLGILAQALDVGRHGGELVHLHATLDPPHERRGLVAAEVVAGLAPQQRADARQLAAHLLGERVPDVLLVQLPQVARVLDEPCRHLLGRQHVVHHARADRAAEHGVVPGRFGRLRHHHPAVLLDRAQAERAVAARARQQDADGAVALVLRQRVEQAVDRHPQARRRGRLHAQHAALDRQHRVRRDHVHVVRLHRGLVAHLLDVHARRLAEQLRHQRGVVRVEVLHHHERHAAVGRHRGEELLEGLEPAGRGAHPDYGRRRRRRARLERLRRLRPARRSRAAARGFAHNRTPLAGRWLSRSGAALARGLGAHGHRARGSDCESTPPSRGLRAAAAARSARASGGSRPIAPGSGSRRG
jgi:hypothetical protein